MQEAEQTEASTGTGGRCPDGAFPLMVLIVLFAAAAAFAIMMVSQHR